jgi:hypothetical protein
MRIGRARGAAATAALAAALGAWACAGPLAGDAACEETAAPYPQFTRDGPSTDDERRADLEACQDEAGDAMHDEGYDMKRLCAARLEHRRRSVACMEARGWRVAPS